MTILCYIFLFFKCLWIKKCFSICATHISYLCLPFCIWLSFLFAFWPFIKLCICSMIWMKFSLGVTTSHFASKCRKNKEYTRKEMESSLITFFICFWVVLKQERELSFSTELLTVKNHLKLVLVHDSFPISIIIF